MLRRCVWSRNIKNGCSIYIYIYIYIYDISRLRVNALYNYNSSNKGHLEECDKEQNVEVTGATSASCLKRKLLNFLSSVTYSPSHRQVGALMVDIQLTLRTAPDLCKNVWLAVLFAGNGNSYTTSTQSYMRHAVARLVEALRYKSEGRRFDSKWCHWKFSLTQSFWPRYGTGVDPASNINEYQEYFPGGKGGRCVGQTLPPSCADCLEIWKPQTPETLRACPGL